MVIKLKPPGGSQLTIKRSGLAVVAGIGIKAAAGAGAPALIPLILGFYVTGVVILHFAGAA